MKGDFGVARGAREQRESLSPLVQRLFGEFVTANALAKSHAFGRGTTYKGLSYDGLTMEAFVKTPEFAGFTDGRLERPSQYQGPRGAPQPEAAAITLSISFDAILSKTGEGEKVRETLVEMRESLRAGNPQDRYERQYVLGRSYSGRVL